MVFDNLTVFGLMTQGGDPTAGGDFAPSTSIPSTAPIYTGTSSTRPVVDRSQRPAGGASAGYRVAPIGVTAVAVPSGSGFAPIPTAGVDPQSIFRAVNALAKDFDQLASDVARLRSAVVQLSNDQQKITIAINDARSSVADALQAAKDAGSDVQTLANSVGDEFGKIDQSMTRQTNAINTIINGIANLGTSSVAYQHGKKVKLSTEAPADRTVDQPPAAASTVIEAGRTEPLEQYQDVLMSADEEAF